MQHRIGVWISRNQERGEDLQLPFRLSWLEWPGGSQRMPAGVGGSDKTVSGRKQVLGEDLCDPLWMAVFGLSEVQGVG